jgi:hypothetical protein
MNKLFFVMAAAFIFAACGNNQPAVDTPDADVDGQELVNEEPPVEAQPVAETQTQPAKQTTQKTTTTTTPKEEVKAVVEEVKEAVKVEVKEAAKEVKEDVQVRKGR